MIAGGMNSPFVFSVFIAEFAIELDADIIPSQPERAYFGDTLDGTCAKARCQTPRASARCP